MADAFEEKLSYSEIKTVLGKMIRVYDNGELATSVHNEIVKVRSYKIIYSSSKIQGSLVGYKKHPSAEIAELSTVTDIESSFNDADKIVSEMNAFYDNELNMDEDGNEISFILPPIDAVITESFVGIIVDCGIYNYQNGINNLQIEDLPAALETVKKFTKAINTTLIRHYIPKWDDASFHFLPSCGEFYMVFSGMIPFSSEKDYSAKVKYVNISVSEIIHFLLFGTWINKSNYDPSKEFWESFGLSHKTVAETDNRDKDIIPDSFMRLLLCDKEKDSFLSELYQCLDENSKHLYRCPYCRKYTFFNTKKCFNCHREQNISTFGATFQIESNVQPTKFQLSFGRSIIINGVNISSVFPNLPFMQLLYHPQDNILGLRNISGFTWDVCNGEKQSTVSSGSVIELSEGTKISVDGYPHFKMFFCGYYIEER